MANPSLSLLCVTAVTIALVHTLCGPDHYVPFVAMSRLGKWSLQKTVLITLLSGVAHVGSSVVLGTVGIALGVVLTRLVVVEQARGKAAGWLLIGFGLAYLVWGVLYSRRSRRLPHCHVPGGLSHSHGHASPHADSVRDQMQPAEHSSERHAAAGTSGDSPPAAKLTPWVLLTIFVFGPCEPLIPLLMYPAAQLSLWGVVLVTVLFSLTTIAAMLTVVVCLVQGTKLIKLPELHAYSHALAGMAILLCGLAVNFGL